jgi:polyisoprenoid-binding protein YceI
MLRTFIFTLFIIIHCNKFYCQNGVFKTYNGKISFISKATLETIKVNTKKLVGVLNTKTNAFSFKVTITSFDGFNNPLQREHFFENYMEIEQYPESTFTGKVIESIKPNQKQRVRAKGMLTIHGVSKEVMLDIYIDHTSEKVDFDSKFDVLLEDYNISVPKIVRQKISPIINIHVSGSMVVL